MGKQIAVKIIGTPPPQAVEIMAELLFSCEKKLQPFTVASDETSTQTQKPEKRG